MNSLSIIMAAFGFALIAAALATLAWRFRVRRAHRATFIRCKDGDTFVAKYQGEVVTVRLATFDARELNEKGGEEALRELDRILSRAKVIDLLDPKKDQWGRLIAKTVADGRLVGARMVFRSMEAKHLHGKHEYAVPWRGSRDRSWGRVKNK